MSYQGKVYREQGGDNLVVASGGTIQVLTGGAIVANGGSQAAAIADATALTGGESPTETEHNLIITKLNSVLAALRGAGIIASKLMRLRMLVSIAGVGFNLAPGEATERFQGKEAEAMLARGYAIPDDQAPIERAVKTVAAEKRIRKQKAAL